METDVSSILDRVEAVLRERPRGGAAAVARIETTLTDGYAGALALEGEQLRLEKRIEEVSRRLTAANAVESAVELSRLRRQHVARLGDLELLRSRLAELRRWDPSRRAP